MRGRGIDPGIKRTSKLRGQFTEVHAGIFSGSSGDLCGKKIHNQSVLVCRPHLTVAAQEACTRALFSAKTDGAIDQSGHKPLEAYRHFVQLTSEFLYNPVYHATAY